MRDYKVNWNGSLISSRNVHESVKVYRLDKGEKEEYIP